MMSQVPAPVMERMAALFTALEYVPTDSPPLSSRELGMLVNASEATVRQDLRTLKKCGGLADTGAGGNGYQPARLREALAAVLGLNTVCPVVLAGLGPLGTAILDRQSGDARHPIVAAFDGSMNRIETCRTTVPLFHSSELSRVAREKQAVLGIIAVAAANAQEIAQKMAEGGVQAIVNYAPVLVRLGGVTVRNVSVTNELHILAAMLRAKGV